MYLFFRMFHFKLRRFFSVVPHSNIEPNHHHNVFNTYVLVIGCLIVSCIATILSYLNLVTHETYIGKNQLYTLTLITACLFLLLLIAKKGHYQTTAVGIILLFVIPTMYAVYTWTIYYVSPMLTISLLIVLTRLTLSKKLFLTFTVSIIVLIIGITYYQQAVDSQAHGWMKQQIIDPLDSLMYGMLLSIIGVLSWLTNRQIEHLILRVHHTEQQRTKERSLLELQILEHTRDIERREADKVRHLYRFATLGKLTSGLFHDLVNPLTIVSYNLRELETKQGNIQSHQLAETQMLVKNALEGTKKLELFIETVRKQVQNQQTTQLFSLTNELKQVVELFSHKAKQDNITIAVNKQKEIRYKGNPIRFSQLLSNLLSNAMDAYEQTNGTNKRILISLTQQSSLITLSISDYGKGIHPDHLPHLFEPLFTTKSQTQGTGLGLAIVKDIVEFELNGTIQVQSQHHKGTVITITFPCGRKRLEYI